MLCDRGILIEHFKPNTTTPSDIPSSNVMAQRLLGKEEIAWGVLKEGSILCLLLFIEQTSTALRRVTRDLGRRLGSDDRP